MASPSPCPSPDELQRLLLGLIDNDTVAVLEAHLSQCSQCAEAARSVQAEDDLVKAMRTPEPSGEAPQQELVNFLIPLLKRLEPVENTASWNAVTDPEAETLPVSGSGASQGAPTETTTGPLKLAQGTGELGRIGPYVTHEVLGAGGMGVVFRAFDPQLHRQIAIKVVRPELVAKAGMTERFLQEARAIAQVEHDNIVVIHAVENHDGVPCIVMPLLRGQSLEQHLRAVKRPLPLAETLRIGREAASGLAAAHERGLIHRDIKPANMWLEAPNARVRILDFGLAFVRAGDGQGPSGVSGTPGYLSPEQARGDAVDHRADLFSLGCVLYRLASGSPPFPGAKTFTALVRVVFDRPKAVAELNSALPAALVSLIDRLLSVDPKDRPQSAAEVVQALRAMEEAIAVRRSQKVRRRWLVAVAGAAVFSGLCAWALLHDSRPQVVETPPVRVTFVTDPPALRVAMLHDGHQRVVEIATAQGLDLAPGHHTIRLADPVPKGELVPNEFMVQPNQPLSVKLAVVGEVEHSAAHTQPVTGVALAAGKDGFTVLSGSLDRTLGWWRPGTKGKTRFVNLPSPVRSLAVSADGVVAATAGGNKLPPTELAVQLWSVADLEPMGEPLEGHTGLITTAAFAPSGKQLLTAARGEVLLWDLPARTRRSLDGHDRLGIFASAFAAGGTRALTGDEDGNLILWDVAAGKPLQQLSAHKEAIRAVLFTSNGFASAGDDGLIRLWDEAASRDLPRQDKAVLALALSPDGKRLLSGGADGVIRLWSMEEGRLLHALAGHVGPVRSVSFSPDGRQAISGGEDSSVRVWRLPF